MAYIGQHRARPFHAENLEGKIESSRHYWTPEVASKPHLGAIDVPIMVVRSQDGDEEGRSL